MTCILRATLLWLLTLVLLLGLVSSEEAPNSNEDGEEPKEHNQRYHIATFDWDHVEAPYTITLWIMLASVAKIGFHLSKKFSSIFPDSSLLIVLGLIVGIILFVTQTAEDVFHLESEIFFLYLLPPIVFDAGYFMPNRAFFDNLGTILVYAVIGTLWNMISIGGSLWAIGQAGMYTITPAVPLLHMLLFSSLISAVDPVAVLVVFEEIHVNEVLFITVFGESLLNDAVTVVLYHMFESFSEIGPNNIQTIDVVSGLISFFVVGLGGVAIGIIWALIVSFTTRWTTNVRVLEPLFVFAMAYCSYLTAEMFHLSGILAIVFCGIAMKQYVEGNISAKSQTTVKYFLKMLSSSSETIIFMFLGLSTVSTYHHWDTAFVGLTVLFCLVYRAIGVVLQTFFVNKFRMHKLNKVEQFIMAYGGLRGAIAYGLVVALDEETIPAKQMFVTACIVVIYFTVFLQGMTIKPLVNFLKVKKDEKRDRTMNEQIFERMLDHTLAGYEHLLGHTGHHWLRDKYEYYNTKYLKPVLMREPPKTTDMGIIEVYTKLSMKDAMAHLNTHGTIGILKTSKSAPTADFMSKDNGNAKMNGAYVNSSFQDPHAHHADHHTTFRPRRFSHHEVDFEEDEEGHRQVKFTVAAASDESLNSFANRPRSRSRDPPPDFTFDPKIYRKHSNSGKHRSGNQKAEGDIIEDASGHVSPRHSSITSVIIDPGLLENALNHPLGRDPHAEFVTVDMKTITPKDTESINSMRIFLMSNLMLHGLCGGSLLCSAIARNVSSKVLKPHPRPFRFRQWAKTMSPVVSRVPVLPYTPPDKHKLNMIDESRVDHLKELFNHMPMISVCHLMPIGRRERRLLFGKMTVQDIHARMIPVEVMRHMVRGRLESLLPLVHYNSIYLFSNSVDSLKTIVEYCKKNPCLILLGCCVENTVLTVEEMSDLASLASLDILPAQTVSLLRSLPLRTSAHLNQTALQLNNNIEGRKEQLTNSKSELSVDN